MAKGIHSEAVATEFQEHAAEEQQHADQIAERITQLGGAPDFSPEGLSSRSHAEYVEGDSLEEMIKEVERPLRVPLRAAKQKSRQYFIGVLDVESMSLTDLNEVERWLRGELQPAVRGDGNPGTALGRGIRRVFVRLLGAERRNLQARSRTFVVP